MPARFAGDYATARAVHPDFAFAEYQLGLIASGDKNWSEAIEHLEHVLPAMGPILGGAPLNYVYAKAGRQGDALRICGRRYRHWLR